MKTVWRWFFRCVVGIGLLLVAFVVYLIIGLNSPQVTSQSGGFTAITPAAVSDTLSQSLPKTATHIRHCRVSVGIGGGLLIYRFSAPLSDLHSHAEAEFAAYRDGTQLKKRPNSPSPTTFTDIARYKSFYGVDAEWMLPPADAIGTLYEPADDVPSHQPMIFVDDFNGVLYFQMAH